MLQFREELLSKVDRLVGDILELSEKLKKKTDGNEKNEEMAENVKKLWENFRNRSFETNRKKEEFNAIAVQKEKEFGRLLDEFDSIKKEIKIALELKETLAEKRENLQKLQVSCDLSALIPFRNSTANGPWLGIRSVNRPIRLRSDRHHTFRGLNLSDPRKLQWPTVIGHFDEDLANG